MGLIYDFTGFIGEPLTELVGNVVVVEDYSIEKRTIKGNEVEVAILYIDGKEYYTFSKVIIDQVRQMSAKNMIPFRAKLVHRKRYLTFERPTE